MGTGGQMNVEEVRAYIREHHRAVLATMRGDGGVQLSPVLVAADEDGALVCDGRVAIIGCSRPG